ncbi:MAG: recombinase family protein, partial [Ruminococcus flavefaciens]|nr:recombinase family protein [Ruminococcus flavefaciens]MCM1230292.1 recombinase family protein [Ruminococcus flavefaciens]
VSALNKFSEFCQVLLTKSEIARELKKSGCKCTTLQFVRSVLTNVVYVGDLLLQQHYSPTVRCMKKNNGELPKYHVQGHHPAIISQEIFDKVQQKIEAQKNYNKEANHLGRVSCFSSKITCAVCGNHYVAYSKSCLVCFGKLKRRKKICQNGNLIINRLEKSVLMFLGMNLLTAMCS